MSSVTLKSLSIINGSFHLHNISLQLEHGRIGALLGPSGSGKTTLLRAIAGFIAPIAGEIWLGETCVATASQNLAPQHRGVGLVFQNYALFPHLTVAQNIAFGLHGLPKSARQAVVEEWLSRLHISPLTKRYPHAISGGEQQRVALARALAPKPNVLLMDEPFANLDAKLREDVRSECLEVLRAQGVTTLLVTHDETEAKNFATRCYRLMKEGDGQKVEIAFEVC